MTNDTWETGIVLTGDSGSIDYSESATGGVWFFPRTVVGRCYTFTAVDTNPYYSHSVVVYTGDSAGNLSEVKHIWVTVDNTGKPISFTVQKGLRYAILVSVYTGLIGELTWTSTSHKRTGWSEWITPELSYWDDGLENSAPWVKDTTPTPVYPEWHIGPEDPEPNGSGVWPYTGGAFIQASCRWTKDQWDWSTFGTNWLMDPTHQATERWMSSGTISGSVVRIANSGWEDVKNYYPEFLDSMTEGIDYFLRPDRVAGDIDAYIEIEPNVSNVFSGWHIPYIGGGITNMETGQYTSSNHPPEMDGYWDEYHMPMGSSLQIELVENPAGGVPVMGFGTIIAANVHTSIHLDIKDIPQPGPETTSLGLFAYDPNFYTRPEGPLAGMWEDSPYDVWCLAGWDGFLPSVKVATPRYRYWIEGIDTGIPPMRQRHRDDGLATDARQMKGHGSSLQSSIRRGGQVYY